MTVAGIRVPLANLTLAGVRPPFVIPQRLPITHYGEAHHAAVKLAQLQKTLSTAVSITAKAPAVSYKLTRQIVEPDYKRLPGFKDVTPEQWRSAQWQLKNGVRNVGQLKRVFGAHLTDAMADDILRDQKAFATMSMLLPPQMLATMNEMDLAGDPVRRAMIPLYSERRLDWPSHPMASRDSLHEADMWVVPGLTWRYTDKALAEIISTCPQFCAYCTRMDLVGPSVPQVTKLKLGGDLYEHRRVILDFLKNHDAITDVVVSGGDIANVPIAQLEEFVGALLDMEHIRDIRLATKGFTDLPQYFLQDEVQAGLARLAGTARARGINLALHTHITHAQSVTPLVKEATRSLLDMGFRDVRNQSVLLAGVNDTPEALLELCQAAYKYAGIMPYYFYMCDMIPNAEHWRVPLWRAQELQLSLMGRISGYATPRILCDVPEVGKRYVHQVAGYDRTTGTSFWTKNDPTSADLKAIAAGSSTRESVLSELFKYFDPIHTLPPEGQAYWRHRINQAGPG